MIKRKVSVIGLGYVGLPLLCAIGRSEKYDVFGFDIDESKIEKLKQKTSPIEDKFIEDNLPKIKYTVSSDKKILIDTDIFIICVPTPVTKKFIPNYGPVISASKLAAEFVKDGATVIVESTINPGTCREIVKPILDKSKKKYILAHCPERINPGDEKWTVMNIPRNVGSIPGERSEEVADFYRDVLDSEIRAVSTIEVAEATKIIENTFRDINIAFVNELAKSFDLMGIDLVETLQGASNKPFGFMPHWPGSGVGGHCIAVDPYYLIQRAEQVGFDHKLLKEARNINNSMPGYTIERLAESLSSINRSILGTKIALLGLSYKPNVADLRESPALEILHELEEIGTTVNKYDPYTPEENTYKTLEKTLENSDAVILATSHKVLIEKLNSKLLSKYKIRVVVDGRNSLNADDIKAAGIVYKGIGRY